MDHAKLNVINEMIDENQNDPIYNEALVSAMPETKQFINHIMSNYDNQIKDKNEINLPYKKTTNQENNFI